MERVLSVGGCKAAGVGQVESTVVVVEELLKKIC